MKRGVFALAVSLFAFAILGIAQDQQMGQRDQPSVRGQERITKEVRHELLMGIRFRSAKFVIEMNDGENNA